MTKASLTREDWLAAGFRALAHKGPSDLRINNLAKSLGATKGSFYWHFESMGDYKSAMLALWRTKVATEVIDEVQSEQTNEARFGALMRNAARTAPEEFGGRRIEPALRAWSLADAEVAQALKEIDTQRIAFLEGLLENMGRNKTGLATLCYAAYLGLDDLAAKDRADITGGLEVLRAIVLKD